MADIRKTSDEILDQLARIKTDIAEKSQEIINTTMPTKIILLQKMFVNFPPYTATIDELVSKLNISAEVLEETTKVTQDFDQSIPDSVEFISGRKRQRTDPSTPSTVSSGPDFGRIPSNKKVVLLLHLLKYQMSELIDMVNTVKIWVQLNIPQIEDGNDFGVGIQEEIINELSRCESDAFTVLDSTTKYYASRAQLITKMLKHSELEDYHRSVSYLDEQEYMTIRLQILDLRNNYTILHDLITKNRAKLEKPRSSDGRNSMIL
eukprot:TRINITY_DN6804_c0_g2_i1.p1 TRINITY_DN6804_c0_g2~~TRINITY_DN6804_c0_g2_i1.p1  ORF type:complete len:286 (-),score=150.53 TRINITY_DN6804_c0_g2_i1:23-811(-)